MVAAMNRFVALALLIAALGWAYVNADRLGLRPAVPAPTARPQPTIGTLSPSEAPADAAPAPAPLVPLSPKVTPGTRITVELTEPPATRYGGARPSEADEVYGALVASLGRKDVVYDENLGHAAREVAYQQSIIGATLPGEVLDFLLRSAGAVDKSVLQALTQTSDGGDDDPMKPVAARLKELLASAAGHGDGGVHRVGIGEAFLPGARLGRTISILVSTRALTLDPAPRRVELGGSWQLTGSLPPGYSEPAALVHTPAGELVDYPVRSEGRRFTLVLPAGDRRGTLEVSVLATGPHGPSPVLQVPVEVEQPLPETLETTLPEVEVLEGTAAAESLAFDLLNADRARFGLPALQRDPALDAVARGHSRDMRDGGWFGHWSEETGTPGDRLLAAGYRAAGHAENVASARTIRGAQEGLFHSLGHRRNILSRDMTHIGIGVVGKREGKDTQWYLTQMYARPTALLDTARAREALLARLNSERATSGAEALAASDGLDQLARTAALTAARGGNDAMAKELMDAASGQGETRRGGYAWVQTSADLESLKLPEALFEPGLARIGLAVVQLPDHPSGIVGVAILATGPR
jgi:uncharacterized protein YkwD